MKERYIWKQLSEQTYGHIICADLYALCKNQIWHNTNAINMDLNDITSHAITDKSMFNVALHQC